jgi:glycosyltransferase involved in cell wall biosynthesis
MSADPALLDLAAILPVYNEAGALPAVLDEWFAALDATRANYELHAYDDGSRDESPAILEAKAAGRPRLVVHRQSNCGHGPTILRAYREQAARARWLFQTDSDGELGPEAFAGCWAIREDFDLVIGGRSGRTQTRPRRAVSAVSQGAVRRLFGPGIRDPNAPYRLLRSAAFAACFRAIPDGAFAPNVLISGYAAARRLRIAEATVAHRPRRSGASSLNSGRLLRGAARALAETIAWRFAMPR